MVDVAIVGAGPVGAALALMLARSSWEVALFEARGGPAEDSRTLALSHASHELLADVGAWPTDSVTPIASIHISQRGGPGRTVIEAQEQRVPALGYTLPFAALERSLLSRLKELGVPVHFGNACEEIALDPAHATLRLASGRSEQARLLVLADGGANASRIPGIAFIEKDYGQRAVVSQVRCDRPHAGRAYERFTTQGPIALLPLQEGYALVWTADPEAAARLESLEQPEFLSELQEAFGDRAGRFVSAGVRASFPLKLRAVNTPIALRTVLIGNAAQALHPIAGQGLNLGLRDAATLGDCISAAARESLGGSAMLASYRDARRRDASRGVAFTDFLVSAFGDPRRLPTWGRALALTALDIFPSARRILAQRMIHGAPTP